MIPTCSLTFYQKLYFINLLSIISEIQDFENKCREEKVYEWNINEERKLKTRMSSMGPYRPRFCYPKSEQLSLTLYSEMQKFGILIVCIDMAGELYRISPTYVSTYI